MIKRLVIILILTLTCATFLPAQQKGMASYYSRKMHGRRMSDGSRYHNDSLTCAHARYPFGTMLKVTNLKNGKTVVVRVADRCGTRRIIDLSYAAAKQLGILQAGVAMVRVEKYNAKHGVPYKEDSEIDVPELDFEVTEKGDKLVPDWQKGKTSTQKKATTRRKSTAKRKTRR